MIPNETYMMETRSQRKIILPRRLCSKIHC